jgi:hypothetical protein
VVAQRGIGLALTLHRWRLRKPAQRRKSGESGGAKQGSVAVADHVRSIAIRCGENPRQLIRVLNNASTYACDAMSDCVLAACR